MSNPKKLSFQEMTKNALETLHERRGTSISAIGKYIVQTYGIDMDKSKVHLKRYLLKAVEKGEVIQTKGKGFTGSFKLPAKDKEKNKKKKNQVVKDSVRKGTKAGDVDATKKHAKKMGPKNTAKAKLNRGKNSAKSANAIEGDKSVKKLKEKKSKDKKGKDGVKAKAKQTKTKTDKAKIVLKRASLIGGMVIKKKMPKSSKPKESTTEGA